MPSQVPARALAVVRAKNASWAPSVNEPRSNETHARIGIDDADEQRARVVLPGRPEPVEHDEERDLGEERPPHVREDDVRARRAERDADEPRDEPDEQARAGSLQQAQRDRRRQQPQPRDGDGGER